MRPYTQFMSMATTSRNGYQGADCWHTDLVGYNVPDVNRTDHLSQVGSHANFIPLNRDRIKALDELPHKGNSPVYAKLFFFSRLLPEINDLFRSNDKNGERPSEFQGFVASRRIRRCAKNIRRGGHFWFMTPSSV